MGARSRPQTGRTARVLFRRMAVRPIPRRWRLAAWSRLRRSGADGTTPPAEVATAVPGRGRSRTPPARPSGKTPSPPTKRPAHRRASATPFWRTSAGSRAAAAPNRTRSARKARARTEQRSPPDRPPAGPDPGHSQRVTWCKPRDFAGSEPAAPKARLNACPKSGTQPESRQYAGTALLLRSAFGPKEEQLVGLVPKTRHAAAYVLCNRSPAVGHDDESEAVMGKFGDHLHAHPFLSQ